jgi:hypothetical protein
VQDMSNASSIRLRSLTSFSISTKLTRGPCPSRTGGTTSSSQRSAESFSSSEDHLSVSPLSYNSAWPFQG